MLETIPLRAFADNYIWCLHRGRHAVIIDPGDAAPVLSHLERARLEPTAILITHHHADHVDGITAILDHHDVPVYGPLRENIAGVTHPVSEGDTIKLATLGIEFAVLDVPAHTLGHVAYYGVKHLFCGDTLFGGGCGRLFEGTPQQMYASLQKLAALPDDTRVCCAHEYTLVNLRFALSIEPDNAALHRRLAEAQHQRELGLPTLPSTIALEKRTNPFLRCHDSAIVAAVTRYDGTAPTSPQATFAALRRWRDIF
ncbi:MAG: hydroxyacylglutathione hydrolase [Pseudomonadota bacterium]